MEGKPPFQESYKKLSLLGQGSYGKAFLVKCASDGVSTELFIRFLQSLAVIKKIDIKRMSEEEKRNTYREAKILELLSHPGIIHFREIYKNSAGELCIVMDYADGKKTHIQYYLRW